MPSSQRSDVFSKRWITVTRAMVPLTVMTTSVPKSRRLDKAAIVGRQKQRAVFISSGETRPAGVGGDRLGLHQQARQGQGKNQDQRREKESCQGLERAQSLASHGHRLRPRLSARIQNQPCHLGGALAGLWLAHALPRHNCGLIAIEQRGVRALDGLEPKTQRKVSPTKNGVAR